MMTLCSTLMIRLPDARLALPDPCMTLISPDVSNMSLGLVGSLGGGALNGVSGVSSNSLQILGRTKLGLITPPHAAETSVIIRTVRTVKPRPGRALDFVMLSSPAR